MPRTSPPERLRTIVDAATQVFLAKGYKRTLMTEVAGALELSPGTLYNHVESKEALFHLCLLPGLELPKTPPPFPTPSMDDTLDALRHELKVSASFPRLQRALRQPDDDAVSELREILVEFYDRVESRHLVLALIERSAHDIPELGEFFYTKARKRTTDKLAEYIRARSADGSLGRVDDPETAAMLLRESISWFAYHRYFDPGAYRLDDESVSGTVIDLLLAGFGPR